VAEVARTPGAELPRPEIGREVMRQACARHGVPAKITDPAVLAKVAGMVLEVLDRKAARARSTKAAK
jgi:hypothetical protein